MSPRCIPACPGRSAHDRDWLRDPAPDAIAALLDAGADTLEYVTLAREQLGGLDAVAQLAAAGARVAVCASNATDDEVRAAADASATHYAVRRDLSDAVVVSISPSGHRGDRGDLGMGGRLWHTVALP